jgi:glycosyltransferase involved in cell wall biosynthesis
MLKDSDSRHILIIHQHFCPPNGFGNNRSYEVAKNLIALGHRVTILTGSGNFNQQPKSLFSSQLIEGIQVDCIRVHYNHHMSYMKRVWSFIVFFLHACYHVWKYKKSVDLIYAVSTPLSVGLIGIWFKKIIKKPLFFEIGDLWPDVPIQMGILKNQWIIKLSYIVEQLIYNKSNHIVLLSEGMKEYLLHKNIAATKMTVLCNGTNIQQFLPAENKSVLRNQYNISNDTFIVLYAGTIGLANGLDFFIDVAEVIQKKKATNIGFYFIGNGNRLTEIKSSVKEKKLRNIFFIESMPKENIVDYFKMANLGIVSFIPFKILETNSANKYYDYLASGLPVIINYEGWQKKALEINHCGFSTPTITEATEALLNIASNTDLYQQMSSNARALAVKEYNRNEISLQLHTLILLHS